MTKYFNLNLKALSLALLAAGFLSGGVTLSAYAADAETTEADSQEMMDIDDSDSASENESMETQTDDDFIVEQEAAQILATNVIGLDVRDQGDEDDASIGEVSDLIINDDDELVGIVVGVGGFLGIGQKDVGLPWSRVQQIDIDEGVITVEVSEKELEDAPEFRSSDDQEKDAELEQSEAGLDDSAAALDDAPVTDTDE